MAPRFGKLALVFGDRRERRVAATLGALENREMAKSVPRPTLKRADAEKKQPGHVPLLLFVYVLPIATGEVNL